MDKVRPIKLSGYLGAKFGRSHSFVVRSPKDAIRALIALIPGFERELMTSKDRGIVYAVFVGKRNLTEKELEYPSGDDVIRIAPILRGSKAAGLFQTIAGVALAVVGAISGYFGNPYASQMVLMGASMALGGVAQMISAHATSNNGSSNNTSSYYFSGAQNTTSQGGPVPLLYGRMRVGSTVISAGISAADK